MKFKPYVNILIPVLSGTFLLISLTQKSYCMQNECADALASFILGSLGFLTGGATLCWLANPFLLLSWFLFKKFPLLSWVFSSIALVTGLCFLGFKSILANEAGHYNLITGYAAGYWLWISSMAIMFVGNSFKLFCSHQK